MSAYGFEAQVKLAEQENERLTAAHESANQAVAEEGGLERNLKAVARHLRRSGTLVLLVAAVAFLAQGLSAEDSIGYCQKFLQLTLVIAGFGLFSGLWMKDDKGGRTFLAIATGFVTVHFAQLGAMIYSLTGRYGNQMPSSFAYQAEHAGSVVAAVVMGLVLLLPVAYLGFSALTKEKAKILLLVSTIGNVLLLVPARENLTALIIGAVLMLGTLIVDVLRFSREPRLKTPEGRIARAIMFAPLATLIVRNGFYGITDNFLALCFTGVAALIFLGFRDAEGKEGDMQILAVVPTIIAWKSFVSAIFQNFESLTATSLAQYSYIPVAYIGAAMIIFGLSFYTNANRRAFQRIGAMLCVGAAFAQLISVGGVVAALLCVAVGVPIVAASVMFEDLTLLFSGSAALAVGLIYNLKYAAYLYHAVSPWMALAIIGVLTVLASSYLEKNFRLLVARSSELRQRLSSWS